MLEVPLESECVEAFYAEQRPSSDLVRKVKAWVSSTSAGCKASVPSEQERSDERCSDRTSVRQEPTLLLPSL